MQDTTLPLIELAESVPLPGPAQQVDVESRVARWLTDSSRDKALPQVALLHKVQQETESDWPRVGALGVVRQAMQLPDGGVRVLVQPLRRLRLQQPVEIDGLLRVATEPVEDVVNGSTEEQGLAYHLSGQFQRYVDLTDLPDALKAAARDQQAAAGALADLVAGTVPALPIDLQAELLADVVVQERLRRLTIWLTQEIAVLEMGQQIQDQVQQELGQHQRQHILREQMRAIQKELGQSDGEDDLRARVKAAKLPEAARQEAERELDRLDAMSPGAAEASVARTYIEWILDVPWNRRSPDRTDLERAKRVLDEDHEGLEKVKERILEYVAVRKLRGRDAAARGPVLLLVGPPGVGKTSLGRSVARALGRRFARIALGGVRDEAEIRGHRRTYVGAMPGRLVQALRQAGTNNPVIQLDEIDKVGADHRGDPSAALLEVLDPEQNHAFVDHYLDVPVDLSQVVFLATANRLDTIPPALRDRLEVLSLTGYSEDEKVRIAHQHLMPKQWKASGLGRRKVAVDDDALRQVIRGYTREAGLRNLERQLAHIGRKLARRIVEGGRGPFRIGVADVPALLGPRQQPDDEDLREDVESTPGLVAGLAWTPAGGEVMYIEATSMPGEGLRLTGQLGDVMKESAQIAQSYVRSHADELGVSTDLLQNREIHVHLPAGAVPKDGPSAGVALTTSLVSLLTGIPVRGDVAMTGEVTLRGRVLPVGGIEEKVMAARRAGMSQVLLPRRNQNDVEELPASAIKGIEVVFVDDVAQVIQASLVQAEQGARHAA